MAAVLVETTRAYSQPSRIESPAVGTLAAARDGKKRANAVLRQLRQQLRAEPLGGNRSSLRLAILKAEMARSEWAGMERGALATIEQRANELGLTTRR